MTLTSEAPDRPSAASEPVMSLKGITKRFGAVQALSPERVLLMPDAVEDLWNASYEELIQLA